MIYYGRIDAFEGIDVNKTSGSKECGICHYWYFLNIGFEFQSNVSNGCHDLVMMSINLSNIAICCVISGTSKNEAINLVQNVDLIKKGECY